MSQSDMNQVGELQSAILENLSSAALENLSIAPASTPPPPPPSPKPIREMGPGIRHDVLDSCLSDPRDIMAARMESLKHRLHNLHLLDTTVENTVDPLEELQSTVDLIFTAISEPLIGNHDDYSSDAASAGDSEHSSLSEEDRAELKTLGPADRAEFMSLSDADRAEYYKNKRDIAAARHAWGTVMSAMRTFRALRPDEDLKEQLEEILKTL
ncbi:hypothetical protein R3P38DRAFT_2802768 [Favolaschia claudopus]|uniref:Uncharacterized protein n=1 Tax=Favolaschia claudopus TaxID=2862362 RepID=A0AAV9ZUM7_9AGAR